MNRPESTIETRNGARVARAVHLASHFACVSFIATTLATGVAGCAPGVLPSDHTGVLGLTMASGDSSRDRPAIAIAGFVAGHGSYELFDLGDSVAGDEWTVSTGQTAPVSGTFVVILLDADHNLLTRGFVTPGSPLRHVLRRDTPQVLLGVMPSSGSAGGGFYFDAVLREGVFVPAPAAQVVWLSFGPAQDVRVQQRAGLFFPAFDGAMLGDEYADATQAIRDTIVRAMREDYAAYNVTILSSDDEPPPTGPHSTVHFGGDDGALLGLADSVDRYNANPEQNAVVYVNEFARYAAMMLDAEEMGLMIANVASHELGHLLGLYHTTRADAVMDSIGGAWDLAGSRTLVRGELEPTVFAVGFEDAPQILVDTVGLRPGLEQPEDAEPAPMNTDRFKLIQKAMRAQLRDDCGLCRELDR